jgi:hypothetical protein
MMNMTESSAATWQNIAGCLRAELAEYGALLALFSEQQKFLFEREADAVLGLSVKIEHQVRALDQCRHERETLVADFAAAHGQPVSATLRALLPFVEATARPLLEALICEINHLLHRVRRTTRQNHTLLARAVDVHQEVLQQLRPSVFTKIYSPGGRVSIATHHSSATLRAAG